jgi:hypothetical protein
MATRLIHKTLSTAALGIAVVVFGLGVARATPVARTSTVPLAGIKLVSETSVPPYEVAAAARLGNRGAGRLGRSRILATQEYWNANCKTGELVAIDIR